jgi:hypothetical protein
VIGTENECSLLVPRQRATPDRADIGIRGNLQEHGVPVEMLNSNRVGHIVYEDEYQAVAVPFAATRC